MQRLTLALLALALVGLLAGCDGAAAPAESTAAPAAAPATLTLDTPQAQATSEPGAATPTPATSDALADDLEDALAGLEESLQNADTLDDAGLGD